MTFSTRQEATCPSDRGHRPQRMGVVQGQGRGHGSVYPCVCPCSCAAGQDQRASGPVQSPALRPPHLASCPHRCGSGARTGATSPCTLCARHHHGHRSAHGRGVGPGPGPGSGQCVPMCDMHVVAMSVCRRPGPERETQRASASDCGPHAYAFQVSPMHLLRLTARLVQPLHRAGAPNVGITLQCVRFHGT